ncbi:MAG: glycosyltransferase family 9 protein [Candidatus Omnitrophica bacterium]|nr:glycosyltransferase family 9 protein [Candidatus Omnitrophota bacterium]
MDYFVSQDYQDEVFKSIKGPALPKEKTRRIFVFVGRPGLGDLILSIPFFKTLLNNLPNIKEIVYIGDIPDALKNIFNLIPKTRLFYLPEYKKPGKSIKYWARLWIKGIFENIDLSIDTQRYFIFSLFFRFVRARYHAGYGSKRVFSDWKFKEKNRKRVHDTYQTLLLSRAIGIKNIDISPCLDIPDRFLKPARDYIKENNLTKENLVAFFPGAGIAFKRWPYENFKKLGEMLIKENYKILLFGNYNEIDLLKKTGNSLFPVPGFKEPLFFSDPLYTAGLLKYCRFSVSNDCGGAHLSSFAGISVVAIFGPTSPVKFAPLGNKNILFYKKLPCSPCSMKSCHLNKKCLIDITPEEVFQAIKELYLIPGQL